MTTEEKLRFLADRIEDGKEFYIGNYLYAYHNRKLMRVLNENDYKFSKSILSLNDVNMPILKLKPQWEFTEDEKVILRNLPEEYQWIARDENENDLFGYALPPIKNKKYWACNAGNLTSLNGFKHLFQSIQWSDDEPCEFRRFL